MARLRSARSAGLLSLLSLLSLLAILCGSPSLPAAEREVVAGIATNRPILGAPLELAGRRIVFTNWHYIQPGDLDWRDAQGKSVYVHGDSGLFEAEHVGIQAPHGIRLVADKPQVIGPFFRPHRMVIQDGAVYRGWTDSDCYESNDAMQWERKGRLTFEPELNDGLYQIFVDPAGASHERFKAVFTGTITRRQFDAFRERRPDDWEPKALVHLGERDEIHGLFGATSADGLRWTVLPEPLVVEYSDSWNTAYYDAALGEYVIYTRYWSLGQRTKRLPPDIRGSWTGVGRRAIGRTSSRDFRRFAPSELVLEPTPHMLPSEQLYTNCRTTIPGAPDQHLMFPTIWNGSVDDTTRIALASSHDGINWHWVPGGDLLRTPNFGRWDGGCIWATPDLIELPNGDWALPYIANNVPHKYPRGQRTSDTGYAVWPKGRMVAVEAEDDGEFTLMPVMPPGNTLWVNAVTQRTGWIKVEVLGMSGRSIADCRPIIGDQHWTKVTWQESDQLGVGENQPVTLRIQMKHARLYGLEFR